MLRGNDQHELPPGTSLTMAFDSNMPSSHGIIVKGEMPFNE